MRLGPTTFFALLLALAAPSKVGALGPLSLTLEGWGGAQRVDPLHLTGGTAAGITPSADDLLAETVDAIGVSLIAKTSFLEVGLSYDRSWTPRRTQVSTLTPVAGVAVDLGSFRLELLGEYGGHRYGQIAGSGERVTVPFVGVRPGLSLRLPIAGSVRLVVGAWFFSRWDLSTYAVAVPAPPPALGTSVYVNGRGPTMGVVGRLGFEL